MLIAAMLTLVSKDRLLSNLIFSNCIGFSIVFMLMLCTRFSGNGRLTLGVILFGVPSGVAMGIALGLLALGQITSAGNPFNENVDAFIYSTIIGAIATSYFIMREKRLHANAALAAAKLLATDRERQLTTIQLQLLQAQIEPHFLFNTLSSIVSLVDVDSATAKKMLESLTTYLRSTLVRTRSKAFKVADEAEVLNAYLSIQSIRMGKRLCYSITVDESCMQLPLPPFLIQPLVENSIKHGIEPSINGGSIQISFALRNATLYCEVVDTGGGITKSSGTAGMGMGLDNIRERLHSLFNNEATLTITQNDGEGVTAVVAITYHSLTQVDASEELTINDELSTSTGLQK